MSLRGTEGLLLRNSIVLELTRDGVPADEAEQVAAFVMELERRGEEQRLAQPLKSLYVAFDQQYKKPEP